MASLASVFRLRIFGIPSALNHPPHTSRQIQTARQLFVSRLKRHPRAGLIPVPQQFRRPHRSRLLRNCGDNHRYPLIPQTFGHQPPSLIGRRQPRINPLQHGGQRQTPRQFAAAAVQRIKGLPHNPLALRLFIAHNETSFLNQTSTTPRPNAGLFLAVFPACHPCYD